MPSGPKNDVKVPDLPPLGEVLYIQSFLPTGDHIRANSVLEVNVPDDLHDTKLGVVAWEESCTTCDAFLENCAGHPGHLELPIPTFRIFFVKRLLTILNCICFYCQGLRLPRSDPNFAWIAGLERKHRIPYLLKYSHAYKRCTSQAYHTKNDEWENKSNMSSSGIYGCCGKLFINFLNEDRDAAFIKAVVPLEEQDHQRYTQDAEWRPFSISPQDLFDCLSNLSDETKTMLGCDEWTEPHALLWDALPIPSQNTRPCHTFAGLGGGKKRVYNDWTKLMRTIVVARNDLLDAMKHSEDTINLCVYSMNDVVSRDPGSCFRYGYLNKKKRDHIKKKLKNEQKRTVFSTIEGCWRHLNKQIAAFHSFKHKKYINKGLTYGKPPVNVEERFKNQKEGRFRGNIIARRVENACRGVLEGDIYLKVNQVGIPKQSSMTLTRKIYVNKLNLREVHQWISNGPFTYPGANYVMRKDGVEVNLVFYENRRDIKLSDVLFVRRHLIDGDLVMVNRQPTLHRPSMMAFSAVVIPGYAIRLHYAVFTPMGADCDGDEVNLHVPQTLQAIAELHVIGSVQNCIMKDGKVWIKFIQNAVAAAFLMSRPDVRLDESEVHDITSCLDLWGYPEPLTDTPCKQWSGHQIISLILPDDFTMFHRVEDEGKDDVVITNGQFISGQLTADMLNGSNGILNHLCRDYAEKSVVMDFLFQGYRVFQAYMDMYGFSAGYFDCAIDPHHLDQPETVDSNVQSAIVRIRNVRENIEKLRVYGDMFPFHNPTSGYIDIETNLKMHIEKINQMMCEAVNEYHNAIDPNDANGVRILIRSGTKGTPNVINQMCGIVSQIYVIYKRFGDTSSHFRRGKDVLRAFGFITQNYSTGIDLPGIISEAHATCESVINKNKGTCKSGYTVRKLTTCLMGIVANHQRQAVDTKGRVVWSVYGNDGYDATMLTNCKLRLLEIPEWEIPKRYGLIVDLKQILKHSSTHGRLELSNVLEGRKVGDTDLERWVQTFESNGNLVDRSFVLDHCFDTPTLERWEIIRGSPSTILKLASESVDILRLRNRLKECMAKSHDAFDNGVVRAPFSFEHLFRRCEAIHGASTLESKVDMTPVEYRDFLTGFWSKLLVQRLVVRTNLALKSLFYDWLSTRSLIVRWRFGLKQVHWLAKEIVSILSRSVIQAGEAVGVTGTQSMGEPFTQMTLKTPHLSGKFPTLFAGSLRITRLIDCNFADPTMTIILKPSVTTERDASVFGLSLVRSYLVDICGSYPTYTLYEYDLGVEKCLIRVDIDKQKAIKRLATTRTVVEHLSRNSGLTVDHFRTSFSTDERWHIYIDIPFSSELWTSVELGVNSKCNRSKIDSDTLVADNIVKNMYRSVVIHGLPTIENFITEETRVNTIHGTEKRWSITTLGTNLSHILQLPKVDAERSVSSDCIEMGRVLGIHAARKSLENEFLDVMSGMSDDRHIKLIARVMASDLKIKGLKIQHMGQRIPSLQRAAYESGPTQMLKYCARGEKDHAHTICGAAIANKLMNVGSGFQLDVLSMPDVRAPLAAKRAMESLPDQMCGYVFSPKVDGVRLYLSFFHDRKGSHICNLTDRNFHVISLPCTGIFPTTLFEGTLLDGDLVRVPGSDKYCFIVFDCLMSCGNRTSVLRYDQRLEIGRELIHRLGTLDLSINLSEANGYTPVDLGLTTFSSFSLPISKRRGVSQGMFQPGNLPFFVAVKPIFSMHTIAEFKCCDLTFPTDGFVMTKLSLPVYPFRMRKEAVYKWKPRSVCRRYNENTIDVILSRNEVSHPVFTQEFESKVHQDTSALPQIVVDMPTVDLESLETFRSSEGEWVMFCRDTNGRPFLFSHLSESKIDFQSGQVYECRWDHQDLTWRVHRLRKKNCNTLETVVLTVKNIMDNIQIEDLCVEKVATRF
jgi:DNA-directed RNA polymerase II subunit RPB1